MNAHADRFARSIKSECLDQMIFLDQRLLERALAEYVQHYHNERTHQGIDNELICGAEPRRAGSIEIRERLGGLPDYYHRRAA